MSSIAPSAELPTEVTATIEQLLAQLGSSLGLTEDRIAEIGTVVRDLCIAAIQAERTPEPQPAPRRVRITETIVYDTEVLVDARAIAYRILEGVPHQIAVWDALVDAVVKRNTHPRPYPSSWEHGEVQASHVWLEDLGDPTENAR